MTAPLDLKFLYYFSNKSHCLIEAKIDGLAQGTPPGTAYHWLYCDASGQHIQKLYFKAMGSEGDGEFRHFEQGRLYFDSRRARLKLDADSTSAEIEFDACQPESIPSELIAQIQHFLQELIN